MYTGFNIQGFGLVLITIFIVVAMIVAHKWIKKVTNCYFLWLAIGAFCFAWLLVFRFVPDWIKYTNYVNAGYLDPGTYENSNTISRAWLLDACPFAGLTMCVLIMADPTRKAARSFAPIALVGGIITIASLMADESAQLNAQFIFFGDSVNECYFFLHFIQIVIPVGIMLNTPKGGWRAWVLCLLMALVYYSYVAIAKTFTKADWFVSGLSINDWESGEYYAVHEIFSFIPLNVIPFIGIPFLYIVASGFMALKDYVFNRGWFTYGNAKSEKWYLWYNYNKHVKQRLL